MTDNKPLISLAEAERRSRERTAMDRTEWKANGIACPDCDAEMMDNTTMVYASSPPCVPFKCWVCGYSGVRTS